MTYHLNKEEVTLSQLQSLLRTAKSRLKGKYIESTPTTATPILAIKQGKWKKRKAPPKQNWKGKYKNGSSSNGSKGNTNYDAPPASDPKEATCFYVMRKDIGNEAALNTCTTLRMGR